MKPNHCCLSPNQYKTLESLSRSARSAKLIHLWTHDGIGRTTILQHLAEKLNATVLGMRDFVESQLNQHPQSLEETLFQLIKRNLHPSRPLILDDFHLLLNVEDGCSYPRAGFFDVVGQAILEMVMSNDCQLIVGTNGRLPDSFRPKVVTYGIRQLEADDYQHLMDQFDSSASIDVDEVHRFAPRLTFYQLTEAAHYCQTHKTLETQNVIGYLQSQQLTSNVELDEVDQVNLNDLVGVDSLVERLESNVVFPLEDDARSQKYGLKPKRGVLLLGPPGTGKTTIGKALAHRLRGKFFLIDGTVISGTDYFYGRVARIFEEAKSNAPSVIFIDDSDVIFESGQEHGLYRYLLTMLDGLESESSGSVCVILTAMDIRHIPPALIRSGRVELWLETTLPDQAARARLIEQLLDGLDHNFTNLDVDEVAAFSDGCTPADLKRLMNEAKTKYAWDESQCRPLKSLTQYALDSIEELQRVKRRYQERRQADDEMVERPVWFSVASP